MHTEWLSTATGTGLSGNPLTDVQQLFQYPFMVNAFRAGTIVAIVAGALGWFMVLRRQAFAGHTIALVGFPGAAGATLLGIGVLWGYFGFCVIAALAISAVPHSRGRAFSQENAVTGTVQALLLAFGYLFVSLYAGNLNGIDSILFGSFLGITSGQVVVLLVVGVAAVTTLGVVSRPLLLASVDPDVAVAQGVPVARLSVFFLLLLGLAAAEASQITGTLLVFALLVMPAAAAQQLTSRPVLSMALTVGIGLAVTWAGLAIAYYSPYPIGFWVTTLAFGVFLTATLVARFRAPRVQVVVS